MLLQRFNDFGGSRETVDSTWSCAITDIECSVVGKRDGRTVFVATEDSAEIISVLAVQKAMVERSVKLCVLDVLSLRESANLQLVNVSTFLAVSRCWLPSLVDRVNRVRGHLSLYYPDLSISDRVDEQVCILCYFDDCWWSAQYVC